MLLLLWLPINRYFHYLYSPLSHHTLKCHFYLCLNIFFISTKLNKCFFLFNPSKDKCLPSSFPNNYIHNLLMFSFRFRFQILFHESSFDYKNFFSYLFWSISSVSICIDWVSFCLWESIKTKSVIERYIFLCHSNICLMRCWLLWNHAY